MRRAAPPRCLPGAGLPRVARAFASPENPPRGLSQTSIHSHQVETHLALQGADPCRGSLRHHRLSHQPGSQQSRSRDNSCSVCSLPACADCLAHGTGWTVPRCGPAVSLGHPDHSSHGAPPCWYLVGSHRDLTAPPPCIRHLPKKDPGRPNGMGAVRHRTGLRAPGGCPERAPPRASCASWAPGDKRRPEATRRGPIPRRKLRANAMKKPARGGL